MRSGLCICFYALVLYGWWRDVWSLDRMLDHLGVGLQVEELGCCATSMYRKGRIKVECRCKQQPELVDVRGGHYNFELRPGSRAASSKAKAQIPLRFVIKMWKC
ncbi:hypothetical protein EDD22DRAFT_866046 [Suillus occidentalis]|nr:hypothetical protein EDD22DRAFT_866046 [Suillus occidentalis]